MKIIFLHTLRSIRDNRTQLFVILLTVSLATMLLFATFILKDLFYNIQYSMASRLCGNADIAIEGEIFSESELQKILENSPCSVQQVDTYTRLTGLFRKNQSDETETAVQIEATDLTRFIERNGDKLFYKEGISANTVYCYPQVWIDESFADSVGLQVGDEVEIYISVYDDYCPFTVTYIFEEKGVFANTTMNNVFTDFESIGNKGLINTAYIELENKEDGAEMISYLQDKLDSDKLTVKEAVDYEYINNIVNDNRQLVRIALLFVVTLVFFILTTSYQVIFRKRTTEINIFRATGATTVQYMGILLFEGLFYGVIGSIFGIVSARLALQIVALEVIPTFTHAIVYTATDYIAAFLFGVLLSVVSAFIPLFILTRKTVKNADGTEKKQIKKPFYLLLIPLFLAILSCLLVIYFQKKTNFLLIFGVVLLSVLFVYLSTPFLLEIISKLFLWTNGTAKISSALYRNKNAVRLTSILTTVIVFTFLVVNLISVISDAVKPSSERIKANLITQTVSEKTDMSAVNQAIRSTYGIEKSYLYFYRSYTATTDEKEIECTLYAVEEVDALDFVTTGLSAEEKEEFVCEENRIVLSYDLANRFSVKKGDSFSISIEKGKTYDFTVVAIDNSVTKNDRVCYILKGNGIDFSDALILSTLKKSVPSEDVYKELHEKLLTEHCYIMFNEDFNESLSIGINGIELLLRLLQIAVSFVAFIGIINMTVSMQTEREKEYKVFYSVGMSRAQKTALSFFESLIIGFSAGVTGTVLSLLFNLTLPSLAKIIDRYISISYFPTEIPVVVVSVIILYSLFYVLLTYCREKSSSKDRKRQVLIDK